MRHERGRDDGPGEQIKRRFILLLPPLLPLRFSYRLVNSRKKSENELPRVVAPRVKAKSPFRISESKNAILSPPFLRKDNEHLRGKTCIGGRCLSSCFNSRERMAIFRKIELSWEVAVRGEGKAYRAASAGQAGHSREV